jgi:hypothetical protein
VVDSGLPRQVFIAVIPVFDLVAVLYPTDLPVNDCPDDPRADKRSLTRFVNILLYGSLMKLWKILRINTAEPVGNIFQW